MSLNTTNSNLFDGFGDLNNASLVRQLAIGMENWMRGNRTQATLGKPTPLQYNTIQRIGERMEKCPELKEAVILLVDAPIRYAPTIVEHARALRVYARLPADIPIDGAVSQAVGGTLLVLSLLSTDLLTFHLRLPHTLPRATLKRVRQPVNLLEAMSSALVLILDMAKVAIANHLPLL